VIARDVLRWLNEGGDKTLAPRREVIKRVSEFEDFSTCYESDRYKAQGLVAQIQKVVNVKDSFTRINLERERERKHRQELHVASIKAKQKEAEERAVIKDSLYKLFAETDPYKRGKRLEGILNSLFSLAGFLILEAFTVRGDEGQGIIEQTDGAVEIDGMLYLVEMKWWDKPIGDRKLPRTRQRLWSGECRWNLHILFGVLARCYRRYEDGAGAESFRSHRTARNCPSDRARNQPDAFFKEKINRAKSERNPFYKVF